MDRLSFCQNSNAYKDSGTEWEGGGEARSTARYLESSAVRPSAESPRWSLMALPGAKAHIFALNLQRTLGGVIPIMRSAGPSLIRRHGMFSEVALGGSASATPRLGGCRLL